MARHVAQNLFDDPAEELATAHGRCTLGRADAAPQPRRVRRPDECHWRTYDLRSCIRRSGKLSSLILWGPPGTGKTTLARLIAQSNGAKFIALSAVLAGVREVRAAIDEAKKSQRRDARTILFIDEIHRFNKAQQDALLGAVEDGTISLIGATTENPSFEVNSALLSRVPRGRS